MNSTPSPKPSTKPKPGEKPKTTVKPIAMISIEMVYRGLYHFSQASQQGRADDPVTYLARKASVLNLIKAKRPKSLDSVRLLTNLLRP